METWKLLLCVGAAKYLPCAISYRERHKIKTENGNVHAGNWLTANYRARRYVCHIVAYVPACPLNFMALSQPPMQNNEITSPTITTDQYAPQPYLIQLAFARVSHAIFANPTPFPTLSRHSLIPFYADFRQMNGTVYVRMSMCAIFQSTKHTYEFESQKLNYTCKLIHTHVHNRSRTSFIEWMQNRVAKKSSKKRTIANTHMYTYICTLYSVHAAHGEAQYTDTKKANEIQENTTRFANLRVYVTIHCGLYRGRDNICTHIYERYERYERYASSILCDSQFV